MEDSEELIWKTGRVTSGPTKENDSHVFFDSSVERLLDDTTCFGKRTKMEVSEYYDFFIQRATQKTFAMKDLNWDIMAVAIISTLLGGSSFKKTMMRYTRLQMSVHNFVFSIKKSDLKEGMLKEFK